jgi:hypothetical protein
MPNLPGTTQEVENNQLNTKQTKCQKTNSHYQRSYTAALARIEKPG